MSALADDLRAARALIDTPEKFDRLGIVGAFNAALGDKTKYGAGVSLLRKHGALIPQFSDGRLRHKAALELFDRAIAAAEREK